jgi:ribosomal protein L15E
MEPVPWSTAPGAATLRPDCIETTKNGSVVVAIRIMRGKGAKNRLKDFKQAPISEMDG